MPSRHSHSKGRIEHDALEPRRRETMNGHITRVALSLCVAVAVLGTAQPALPSPDSGHASDEPGEVLVIFDDDVIERETFLRLADEGAPPGTVKVRRANALTVRVPKGRQAREFARSLRGLQDVTVSAPLPKGTVRALGMVPPNDTAYEKSGVQQRTYMGPSATYPHSINLEPVWDAIFNGSEYAMVPYREGTTIAVIDSGVTPTLREETGEYTPVWDYVDGDADTSDVYGHGTKVASVIRAQANNRYGIAGALGESTNNILVYRTINGTGVGDSDDSILALMDAADRGAKVINASLGDIAVIDAPSGGGDFAYNLAPDTELRAAWDEAVAYCVSKGSIVVASAGNSANWVFARGDSYPDLWYPAASPGALAVGAIDPATGLRSDFSCYGPQLDLMAAGESTWAVNKFDTAEVPLGGGTSYSAPLVAGTLGLLWSLVPDTSGATMRSILTQTAVDYPVTAPDGRDDWYGHGLIDAVAAYERMKATLPVQGPVSVKLDSISRRDATISWSAGAGSGVFYRYGVDGGPEYETTAHTGRIVLPADGPQSVYVRSYARDRWSAQTPGTVTVSPWIGRATLRAERLEGTDRYATSASVSRRLVPEADSLRVVLTSGANWPDALSASVLARAIGGPLLLTRERTLPVSTRDELVRLAPSEVVVVGGTGAVSAEVASLVGRLLPAASVRRIGGVDRYETAALVAREVKSVRGSIPFNRAVIASGLNFPDALSGAPMAADAGWPILLTRTDSVPTYTKRVLSDLGITHVLVLGGDGAVSATARAALPPLAAAPLAGPDRYATSRAVADYARSIGVLEGRTIGFTTGRNYPDALSAGPLLASLDSPAILVDSANWDLDVWLASQGDTVQDVVFLGGSGVLSHDREFDLRNALRAQ